MAPQRKKRKTNSSAQKFLCFSCMTERVSSQFPDHLPSDDCDHLINICKGCLKKWVEAKVEDGVFVVDGEDGRGFGVKCPQCEEGVMRNADVEVAATRKVYVKFDRLERKHVADTIPGWRWCLNLECRAGKVHESDASTTPISKSKKGKGKAKSKTPEVSNICTCDECGAQACVTCDRPWHEGETCAEYQVRIKDRIEEEDQALREIKKKTKACPNPACKKRIEKNGGCPLMMCVACLKEFCWTCDELFVQGRCGCNRLDVVAPPEGGRLDTL